MAAAKSDLVPSSHTDRILYILHYHHPARPGHLDRLLNTILPAYLPPSNFDLVVMSPLEERLPVNASSSEGRAATSCVNPFVPRDVCSKYSSNSYMSLPLAWAKFLGNKGYLASYFWFLSAFWSSCFPAAHLCSKHMETILCSC
jgi:hypothetical protein